MQEGKDALMECLKAIPVSINNIRGDPFIAAQIEDTFYKLEGLRQSEHKGPISIITKFNLDAPMLERLSSYRDMEQLIVFYSLTGMNEGGIPFEERIKIYKELSDTMPNVVLLYRPIVEGCNDSLHMIRTMVDLCSLTETCLVYTGLYVSKGRYKEKFLAPKTEDAIVEYAREKSVKTFPKSACATSYILGDICFAHVSERPVHLAEIQQLYDLEVKEGNLFLPQGTPGDRNFVRFITHSNSTIIGSAFHHFLSIGEHIPLLCSSSWFSWSQITPCSMRCWYCLAEYVFPESTEPERIGCNPVEILDRIEDGVLIPSTRL